MRSWWTPLALRAVLDALSRVKRQLSFWDLALRAVLDALSRVKRQLSFWDLSV
jgi:hypothetical protein